MSELRSKCCGAETYIAQYVTEESKKTTNYYEKLGNICSKCHKPTDVEEKEETEAQKFMKNWLETKEAK